MKKILYLICPVIISISTSAQSDNELKDFKLDEEEIKEIESLKDNTDLKVVNKKHGLVLAPYNTSKDKNKFSILGHLNKDLASITDVMGLEFSYSTKYELAWLEFYGLYTKAIFSEISQNNNYSGPDSIDLQESSDTLTAFGIGLGYRSNWIQTLIDSDRVFTTTNAAIGYYNLQSTHRAESYKGPGIKAAFGLHRRTELSMHYGFNMTYHLAHVKKAKEFDSETSAERSLLLTWLSLGCDISFYF